MLRPPRFRVLRAFLGGPVFATSLVLLLTIAPALAGDVYDAVLLGDVAAVRELIARKADLDEPGDLGTPLHAAATKGNSEIAGLLIDNGADVEATEEFSGKRPLHAAAALGKTEVAELLIARGADLEARDVKGRVPLILAAIGGHTAAVEQLLVAGADANATEPFEGSTALHNAADTGRVQVVEVLLAHGATPDPLDEVGAAPLHWAAHSGRPEVIRLLVARGADVNRRAMKRGLTPIEEARGGDNPDATVALLRELGAKD